MKVFDYYSDFEGEPEIRVIQTNKDGQHIAVLKLWAAYFNTIIQLIEPNDKGFWEGVTLQYHLHTGWYDNDYWACNDVALFLKQLESIDENKLKEGKPESIERESYTILKILKSMLKETVDSKGKIIIEYD
jgi:hypothetical protein